MTFAYGCSDAGTGMVLATEGNRATIAFADTQQQEKTWRMATNEVTERCDLVTWKSPYLLSLEMLLVTMSTTHTQHTQQEQRRTTTTH